MNYLIKKVFSKRRHFLWLFLVVSILIIVIFVPIGIVKYSYKSKAFSDIKKLPERKVALVLGAAIWGKNTPSHVLEDRLLSAVELYRAGKAEKLIMSGDNGHEGYSEPQTMKNYAEKEYVLPEDIVLDYAGFRTYDSCYRARDVFGQREVVIVTQDFHLARALYICNELGLDAVGYRADIRELNDSTLNSAREFFASWLAWWQINITKPKPKFLGDQEKVF